ETPTGDRHVMLRSLTRSTAKPRKRAGYWWRIAPNEAAGWQWQCLDTHHLIVAQSCGNFADHGACYADAQRNGCPNAPVAHVRQAAALRQRRSRERAKQRDRRASSVNGA